MPEKSALSKKYTYKNRHTGEIKEFTGAFLYWQFEKDWELLKVEDE